MRPLAGVWSAICAFWIPRYVYFVYNNKTVKTHQQVLNLEWTADSVRSGDESYSSRSVISTAISCDAYVFRPFGECVYYLEFSAAQFCAGWNFPCFLACPQKLDAQNVLAASESIFILINTYFISSYSILLYVLHFTINVRKNLNFLTFRLYGRYSKTGQVIGRFNFDSLNFRRFISLEF